MPFYIGLIIGAVHFLIAHLVWKRGLVKFLAGYVDGEIKDKYKLSKYAGILLIGAGLIATLFTLVPDQFYYFIFGLYFLWLFTSRIIINYKIITTFTKSIETQKNLLSLFLI